MSSPEPLFREYGAGGDEIGARRSRRAFRLSVAALLFLTGILYFSEKFLRYEQTERLYRSAITLPQESARPLLQSAAKQDAALHETPTPKYLEALAEREEDEKVLPTYAQAYSLDPNNTFLAIRYGCRLFLEGTRKEAEGKKEAAAGLFKTAGELFRAAQAHPPKNALPMYLEAAATPWSSDSADALGASLALVARSNSSGERIVFPRPLWFSGLPQRGAWYEGLRRQIIDECCASFYLYAKHVTECARADLAQHQVQYWDSWLQTLRDMGQHLLRQSDLGSLQAIAGLQIQLDAVELLGEVRRIEKGAEDPDLQVQVANLKAAQNTLNQFEDTRDERIESDRAKYRFPLTLCWRSFLVMTAFYLFSILLSKVTVCQTAQWTVPHTLAGKSVLMCGSVLLLILLVLTMILQRSALDALFWMNWIRWAWWSVFGGLLFFGLLYPALALPRPDAVSPAPGKDGPDQTVRLARVCRRGAWVTLVRRYYGIMGGLLLSSIAIWILLFRITMSLYPSDTILLTTGLLEEELNAVSHALSLLR